MQGCHTEAYLTLGEVYIVALESISCEASCMTKKPFDKRNLFRFSSSDHTLEDWDVMSYIKT